MNFADFSSFADPFAGVVVELANANRLHVTHCVTLLQTRQLVRRCRLVIIRFYSGICERAGA